MTFMQDALKDAHSGRQQRGGRATVGAVMVDPALRKAVSSASRERQIVHDECPSSMRDHPLHHAVMLCVNGVGRALTVGREEAAREEDNGGGKLPPEEEGGGEESAKRDVAEGAGECSGKDSDLALGVEVLSPKQYLCTGFDLYVTREPCLM